MNGISRRECIAAGLAVGACAAIPDDAPKSLNALAEAKGLRFGSCLGTGNPRAQSFEGNFAGSFNDPAVRALTIAQCGIIVPENELKWYALRSDADTFDFDRADMLMDFAQKNALAVRGHTLLWNRAE